MIVHYIEQHGYSPPAEFVSAVLRCPLPDTEEYQTLTEPFWHLHQSPVKRKIDAAEREFDAGNGVNWRKVRDDV